MKRYIIVLVAMVCLLPLAAQGQKGKTAVEFDAATLPEQLEAWMNKSTSDSDKQKENSRTVNAFKASYGAMDAAMQQRVTAVMDYAVGSKMKGNPEVCTVVRVLTAYATAPGGAQNLDAWVSAMEMMRRKGAKAKAALEFVDFSDALLAERVLYRSNSCEWRLEAVTPFRLVPEGNKTMVYVDSPTVLHYASNKDAGTISGTTGRYDYKENEWRGRGGRVDWSRTGLGAESCYADLATYKAETKFPKFTADSVSFVNTHYFSEPISGRIEEALSVPVEPEKYSYPRFRSYQRDFVIPNIVPDVDYHGSFMMNGSKFITASSKHQASLVFRRNGKRQLAVTSTKFVITPERVVSDNATVSLYVGEEDSITNTGVTVRYQLGERRLQIINDPKRNFYSPYIDTYHEMDIYSDVITWRTDGDGVEFSTLNTGTTGNNVTFESSNYYSYRKYREIQGIDAVSPVRRVYDFVGDGSYTFSAARFSDYIGLDMSQTLLMIHNLAHHGLVTYNEHSGRVTMKEKLVDYVKAFAKAKGYDYDALSLESSITSQQRGANATLSLDDSKLVMRGVESFVVSDSQRVVVYPRGGKVTVGRNRSLAFGGRLDVSKFTFFVTDATFDYEHYKFELPQVDSMFFYVPMFDNPDTVHLVMTPLYGLVGDLLVDKPDNHSGLKRNKQYPIFNSKENSYVYYDKREIREGRYDRNRFYYTLHPFTVKSLVRFEIDSVQFNGMLNSGGIFPDITYPLTVQKDYYLGFRIETPAGGYPAYGNRGTYRRTISLDHGGLQGTGELDYLASHSTSQNYLFLLDSMSCTADTFYVKEEGGFPEVHGGRVNQRWQPYADSMSVATLAKGRPLSMYRGEAEMRGRFDIMPDHAGGAGTVKVGDATLVSRSFAMASRQMDAAVSDFTLRSRVFDEVAFTAKDVRSQVDYDGRTAELRMPDGPQRTELQLVRQEAYADLFTWHMDRKTLELANSQRPSDEGMAAMDLRMRLAKGADMPGVRYVSTDPEKQGLTFHSVRSTYRYESGDLSADGVYRIDVADAAVAPAADTLHVDKGGQMRALREAQLVFGRDSAYHLVSRANLVVAGANSLSGTGHMEYTGDPAQTQHLYMDKIYVSPSGHTIAEGTIADSASFRLSPAFEFAGKVSADASSRWMYFDGGIRLIQTCLPREQLGLLAYKGYTDPEHVYIPVAEVASDKYGRRMATSLLMDKNTLRPHPAFLTGEKVVDNELLSAHGVLTWLPDKSQYMIGSEDKVSNPDAVVEPYLAMNTGSCSVEGEGPVTFAMRKTQASLYAYGMAELSIKDNDQADHLATVFGIDFPIDREVVSAMADALKDDLRTSESTPSTSAVMHHALVYHLGLDRGTSAYVEYSATGVLASVPKGMRNMLLFDNVRWQYHPAVGIYYDGRANLVATDDRSMSLNVKLRAQIVKRGLSQQMTFYVEAAKDHWYFFRYETASGQLTIYSSMGTWVDRIKAISADARRVKKDGLPEFSYFVGTNNKEVTNWLQSFSRSLYSEEDF